MKKYVLGTRGGGGGRGFLSEISVYPPPHPPICNHTKTFKVLGLLFVNVSNLIRDNTTFNESATKDSETERRPLLPVDSRMLRKSSKGNKSQDGAGGS